MAEIAPDGFVHPWTRGPCPQCGNETQLTGAAGRPYEECICDSCEMYARGLADGRKESAELREERDTVLALVEEVDAKARARVAELEAEIRHVRQIFRALAEARGPRWSARTLLRRIHRWRTKTMGRSRESYTVAELWKAIEDAYAAACPGWAWAGDPETLVANAKRFREGIERERDEWKERAEAAVGVRMGELERIRAERDALYQLALEASSLFDDIDAGEPGYMEAVDAWRSRIANSREDVGSASAPPIETAADPWDEEWQAWQSVCALLRETGAVTEADCKSWEGTEPTTIGQRLFEAIRAWGLAKDRLEAEHADGGPS